MSHTPAPESSNASPVEGLRLTRYTTRTVKENGVPPPHTSLCSRCGVPYDQEDNFCRHCGLSFQGAQLPSVRNGSQLPVVRRAPLPAAVVRGVAVIAAGTVAELLLRRLARGASRRLPGMSKGPAMRSKNEIAAREDAMPVDAALVSETLLLRRIRIRR